MHDTGRAVSRRTILAGGIAALAGACAPRTMSSIAPPRRQIGVQLYSVAKEAAADLDGTLATLAQIGYETVELAGYIGKTPKELRAALDRAGLKCTSAHVPAALYRPAARSLADDPAILAEEAHILGFDTVIMPLFLAPPRLPMVLGPDGDAKKMANAIAAQMTTDDWRWCADYMNQKGAALKKVGLRFGFHNHGNEFVPVGGDRSALDMMIEETDPALVTFQLDCGWAASTGTDCGDFIRRHKGRISALHIKDVAKTNVPNFELRMDPAPLGQGIIDWPALLKTARANGVHRLFVEQEAPYTRPALETLRDNYEYLAMTAKATA